MTTYNTQSDCAATANSQMVIFFSSSGKQCQLNSGTSVYVKLEAVSGDKGVTVSMWGDNLCQSTSLAPTTSLTLDGTCRQMPGSNQYYRGMYAYVNAYSALYMHMHVHEFEPFN